MRQLIGSPTGHIDRDWTMPLYYVTDENATGLIEEYWGSTGDADPEAIYRKAERAHKRFDDRLEAAGPLIYGINDALISEIKKEMAAIEDFMFRLAEHMERRVGA